MSGRRTRTRRCAVAFLLVVAGVSAACTEGEAGRTVDSERSASARNGTSPPTSSAASSSTADVEPLSEVMADVRGVEAQRAHEVAGGVITVVQGRDHETLAYGSARLHPSRPMTEETRFPIASVTKMMVGTVVLQLIHEGKVHLDDSVENLLPDMLPFGAEVTVEDLLDHRSGIVDVYNDDPKAYPLGADPTDATLRRVLARPPVDKPGTVSRYTNSGFWLLGKIVERTTGHPLAVELRRRVFEPAGMAATTLATNLHDESGLAHGYDERRDDITPGDFTGPWAAGGGVSTVGDVAIFFDQLFGGRLLPADVLTDMTTSRGLFAGSPNVGYGLGVTVLDAACGRVLGHFGDLPGFHTVAFRNPAKDRTVIEFVNTDGDTASIAGNSIAFEAICH